MAISTKSWKIIAQFTLMIAISALIAGVVGGTTSRVAKWKASAVLDQAGNGTLNGTSTGGGMEDSMPIEERATWVMDVF